MRSKVEAERFCERPFVLGPYRSAEVFGALHTAMRQNDRIAADAIYAFGVQAASRPGRAKTCCERLARLQPSSVCRSRSFGWQRFRSWGAPSLAGQDEPIDQSVGDALAACERPR